LSRILNDQIDLETFPVTDAEAVFLTLLFLHLWSTFNAVDDGLLIAPQGIAADVRWLLARPIPRVVWERSKSLQDEEFVAFVEACLNGNASRNP
jgi:hypothetical protein